MAGIAVGSGLAAQIVATAEGTYGVAPSLASARSYEMKSETLELKKTTVTGEGLAAGRVYQRTKRRVLTAYDVNGTVSMDLPTRQMAFWAQFMVGSFGQGLATPAQIASTGIYKSVHQPGAMGGHSFALQKGVPAVDGTVEPFTYVGCKLASWDVTVSAGAIATLNLNIDARNELGSPGVPSPAVPASTVAATNTSAGPAQVVISGGTLTAVVVNGVTVGTVAGTYIVPANGTISITYSSPPTWVWTAASINNDPLNATVPALATFGTPTTGQGESVFHFRQATVYTGGVPTMGGGAVSLVGATAAANVKDVTLQHAFAYDNQRFFLGNQGFKSEQIENGYRSISGSFTLEWLSTEAMYAAFAGDTTTSLQLTFVGSTVSTSNYLFDIIVPNIKLDGETPKVGGPQVVTQQLQFMGLDDEATVPIQITYQSEDTAI